jgi:hypothetical protein
MTCDTLEITIDLEYHTKLALSQVPFVTYGPEKAFSGYFEVLPWNHR